MDSNDVWVNRIWIRFEKSLFSLQSNHGIVHRERNHIANVHLQPIAAFHMTQHVASRQTNQSMKQTRDMLIASMSHCVNWSMQHTPEPNNSGIHSIKFSSTLDSPYFPQHSIRSKPHTNSKKPGKSQWSQDPPRWYYSPNKAPFVLCEEKHSRDDGVHNLQKDRRRYAIVTHVSNDVTSLTVKFLNEHFGTKNYHTGIDLGERLQNCVKNKSKKRLHDEPPIKNTFPILIPLSL